jgi:hypothetical protein
MPRRAMLEDLEPRQDVPEWQGKICYLAMRCSFWWKGAWNDKKDESGIQYRTTFPKLKVLVKGERFFSKLLSMAATAFNQRQGREISDGGVKEGARNRR